MSVRETLVRVGLAEFLVHGYDGTGMAQILVAVGVSRGGFYHHFSGKLALFEEVIARHMPSPLASLDWQAQAGRNAAEQKQAIAKLYQSLENLGQSNGDSTSGDLARYYALFFDALSRLPQYRLDMAHAYSKLIDLLAAALTRDTGIDTDAAQRAARAHIAAFEGELYLWAVTRTSPIDSMEP